MTYPSERNKDYEQTVSTESWKRIAEYVDESDHDGVSPYSLDALSWKDVISALCAYENHIPQTGFDKLYEDYKLYWQVASET